MDILKTKKYFFALGGLIFIPIFLLILKSAIKPSLNTSFQTAPTPTPVVEKKNPTPTSTQQEQNNLQTQSDINFSKKQKAIYDNYPWYGSLPISGGNYFVYFDIDTKKLVAKIYPKKGPGEASEVDALETQIKSKLTALGVNLNTYKIDWQVFPK